MNAGRRSVPTLPVPILRDAVARETAGLSLRKAAREISLSPNGLLGPPHWVLELVRHYRPRGRKSESVVA